MKRKKKVGNENRIIDNTILNFARSSGAIIHGRKALNERLPKQLYKRTIDFDMFVNKPKINARKLEKKLDSVFNRNQFYVKKGEHKGTYKVKNNMMTKTTKDDYTVADLTKPDGKVPYEKSFDGIKFVRLQYLKKKLMQSISNPEFKFRHKKDKETLRLINKLEEQEWT